MADDIFTEGPLSPDEIIKVIDAGLPGLDKTRAAGLGQLSQTRDAKARSLTREQTLLAIKHGNSEHPRLAEAKQRFSVNESLRREIAVMRELSETPLPDPAANTMIVHGFVRRRSDNVGLPGLTLALTDPNGTWVRELGYACTDKRGYFRLDVPVRGSAGEKATQGTGDVTAASSVEAAKREAEAKAAAAAAGRAATGEPAKPALQLRVFNSKGNVLHVEPRLVTLSAGSVDYRYILLGDDAAQCSCTPPPDKPGGQPSPSGPIVTGEKPPTISVPGAPPVVTPAPAEPRVGTLKSYEAPVSPGIREPAPVSPASPGTPLEAIRGIGPKTADKLRAAGVKNVEQYEKTPGSTFVKVAGFDKTPPPAAPADTKSAATPTRAAPEKKTTTRKAPAKKKKQDK